MLHLDHWQWLATSAIFLILEILIGSGFLLWLGTTAALLFVITWLAPNLSWSNQYFLFSLLAIVTSFGWWCYRHYRHPKKLNDHYTSLNRRTEQYVGQSFTLSEAIVNGRGKIRIGDSNWLVNGPDLPNGTVVKIIATEGTVFTVQQAG